MAGIRILRYVLFAVLALIVVFFISSASSSTSAGGLSRGVSEGISKQWSHYSGASPGESETTPQKETAKQAIEDAIQGSKGSKDSKGTTGSSKDVSKDSKNSLSGSLSGSSGSSVSSGGRKTSNTQQTFINSKIATGKMNATFVTLARNGDLWEIVKSIREVEDRFNHKYHYDWVFLNEQPFNDEFKKTVGNLVSGKARFGLIGEEHWSFPSWIDQDKAAAVRQDMKEREIIYGDSVSYRHMCRFESGFFFRQPLMLEYEWYWRVEPSIKLFCDVPYDTFEFMAKNNKMYSFTLSLYEYKETIPTLWDSVKAFMQLHPEHIAKDNSMDFLSDDGGKTYNHCHFWSNFEIGNLNWLRSDAYIDFFSRLDNDGGFFYERWGDAPVHSIAAGLLLNKDQIHFFDDIAYYHIPFTHCPVDEKTRADRKCSCDPSQNFDWNGYSCTAKFYDLHKMKKPAQYEKKD